MHIEVRRRCAVELIVAAAVNAVVCCVQSVSILHLFANTKEPLDWGCNIASSVV
jgi:hypothetical protein